MKFHSQQFPDGRWGIYKELQLMATVGSIEACEEILSCLKSSNKRKPKRINVLDEDSKILFNILPPKNKRRSKNTKRIGA